MGMNGQSRADIEAGAKVKIVLKADQRTRSRVRPAAYILLPVSDIVANQAGRSLHADRAVNTQFILMRVAPSVSGNALIVCRTGRVGTGNVF